MEIIKKKRSGNLAASDMKLYATYAYFTKLVQI